MKQIFKYSFISAFALMLIVSGYLLLSNWILINPNQKFPYSLEYKEFTIRSDEPIKNDLKETLDSVTWRLASVLDYGSHRYHIYLCNNPKTYGIFSKKVGKPQKTQGFNLQPLNHIFINLSFVKEIKSRNKANFQYHILEGNLSHLIAHEICHQLIASRIGFFKMRRIDNWKLEGFCEYSASKRLKENDASYLFSGIVNKFFNGQYDNTPPGKRFYIESMIITEYYLDHHNQSFMDLITEKNDKEALLEEIARRNKEKSL